MNDVPENSARRLLELLTDWKVTPNGKTVIGQRGGEAHWWDDHVEAVACLSAVMTRYRARKGPKGPLEPAFKRFAQGIFATDSVMTNPVGSPKRHFTDPDLASLDLLADNWAVTDPVDPEAGAELLDIARDIEDLVIGAAELGDDLREYLLELARGLQRAIGDVNAFGAADVQRLIHELIGGLVNLMGRVGQEDQQRAGGLAQRLVQRIFKGISSDVISPALQEGAKQVARQAIAAISDGAG